jgi:hypothetical protein
MPGTRAVNHSGVRPVVLAPTSFFDFGQSFSLSSRPAARRGAVATETFLRHRRRVVTDEGVSREELVERLFGAVNGSAFVGEVECERRAEPEPDRALTIMALYGLRAAS